MFPKSERPDGTPGALPRQRVPMSQRRCTCLWSTADARTIPDPFCPSSVLHVDDAERQAVEQRFR